MKRSFVIAVLILALLAGTAHAGQGNALERYVRAPDTAYAYHLVNTLEGDGYRAHVLEMTSQSWRTPEEVDRTVWKHWVTVVVPRSVRHRTALLYVSGGRSTTEAPAEPNSVIARIAAATGAVGVYVQQVPNQPLTFAGDGVPRTFAPAEGSHYYLIVPRNGVNEGSYGQASSGAERPASGSSCLAQSIGTRN